ncbi:putative gustatory receptor 28b [Uranotaenia lowii]|uniref:putative gustatory receptor 28b n=1 Tax=Uranotaenia lowii TaxID=190385 RepID=UPI0024793001|nr:putative gustatory receptor 28b [Uranotaenia lowii]
MKWWYRVDTFIDTWRPLHRVMRWFCHLQATVDFRDLTISRTVQDHVRLIIGSLMYVIFGISMHESFLEELSDYNDTAIISLGMYTLLILHMVSRLMALVLDYVYAFEKIQTGLAVSRYDFELQNSFGFSWNYQKDHLIKYFQTSVTDSRQHHLSAEESSRMLRKFIVLHNQLCDMMNKFNHSHSIQIMFGLATCFGFTTFALFGMIHSYAANAQDKTKRLALSNFVYEAFYLSYMVQIVVYSSLLNMESRNLSVTVNKIISYGKHDRKTLRELRYFSQQLWHNVPKMSCGLFDIDWELFYTIAGSLTTYLIILVQFDLTNFNYGGL